MVNVIELTNGVVMSQHLLRLRLVVLLGWQ